MTALRSWAKRSGWDIDDLTPSQALDLMLDWYANERCADAYPIDEDGDGVLIQWGTYGFDAPPTFHFDVTRQFITAERWISRRLRRVSSRDTALWHLHLTLHFAEAVETKDLSDSLWLFDPNETSAARADVTERGVMDVLGDRRPTTIELTFERV